VKICNSIPKFTDDFLSVLNIMNCFYHPVQYRSEVFLGTCNVNNTTILKHLVFLTPVALAAKMRINFGRVTPVLDQTTTEFARHRYTTYL
jgi:hypothetical protein